MHPPRCSLGARDPHENIVCVTQEAEEASHHPPRSPTDQGEKRVMNSSQLIPRVAALTDLVRVQLLVVVSSSLRRHAKSGCVLKAAVALRFAGLFFGQRQHLAKL